MCSDTAPQTKFTSKPHGSILQHPNVYFSSSRFSLNGHIYLFISDLLSYTFPFSRTVLHIAITATKRVKIKWPPCFSKHEDTGDVQKHTFLNSPPTETNSTSKIPKLKTKLNSVALVRERTIPTERPPPVGEVSANFCG